MPEIAAGGVVSCDRPLEGETIMSLWQICLKHLVEEFGGDFAPLKDYVFNIAQFPLLDIVAKCKVAILPASGQQVKVSVEADGDDLKDIKVSQNGDTIEIRDERRGIIGGSISRGVVISGGSIRVSSATGGSVSIVNGRVFIDGVEQETNGGGQDGKTQKREPRIQLLAPVANLEANMCGRSLLVATQSLKTVNLEAGGQSKIGLSAERAEVSVGGQSTVELAAYALEASVSGQSSMEAQISGGDLRLDVSGQSRADIDGEWAQARVESSGQSSVSTHGSCKGDYRAKASGIARIDHRGLIGGRQEKDCSDMASIRLG